MRKILIAGPCVHEHSIQWLIDQAGAIHEQLGLIDDSYDWIFKASFDKANRTELHSYRGLGLDETLKAFEQIKELYGCCVTTDVHEVWQANEVASVVDIIQIPAMLSRQTDLIRAAARKGQVNIKLGVNMTEQQAAAALDKALAVENPVDPWLTYRGTAFGDELVFDPDRLWQFTRYATTIADVTHSSKDRRGSHIVNARVAAALDVDGLFIEAHPNPREALSDGDTQVPIHQLAALLEGLSWPK